MEAASRERSVQEWEAIADHAGDPDKDRHEQVSSIAVRLCQELLATIMWDSLRASGATNGCLFQVDYGSRELVALLPIGEGWEEVKEYPRIRLFEAGRHGITSHVASAGTSYLSGDVSKDPYYKAAFPWVKSELAVPVVDRSGKVIGVLNMESREPDAFDHEHLSRLEELARQAALVMSLADYEAREKSLLEVGKSLSVLKETETLISEVVDIAAVLLKAQDCSLFLLEDGDLLRLRASVGSLSQFIEKATYPVGEGLTGWAAAHNQPVRVNNPRADPRWRGLYNEFAPEELAAFLAVPVRGREEILGVMRVVRRKWLGDGFNSDFTEDDEGLMTTLASQLGVALENAKLVEKLVEVERMAAWGQLSARAAHMIGNTVFAVKGDLNELVHRVQEEGANHGLLQLLDNAHKGIFRLEEVLQEFKDFVMATRLVTSSQQLDELVRELLGDCFPRDTSVRLTTELASEGAQVEVDVAKLRRCCQELILDSLRALQGKGNIIVKTALAAKEEAEALGTHSLHPDFVKIEIADDGPGISEDNKEKIFTPFFTTGAKGMGLGLSIVKGIVEAHGGVIREVGKEGKGAHFVILLPRREPREPRDE